VVLQYRNFGQKWRSSPASNGADIVLGLLEKTGRNGRARVRHRSILLPRRRLIERRNDLAIRMRATLSQILTMRSPPTRG
jgi:hypothetical protein